MTSRPFYSFFQLEKWSPHDELNACSIPLNYKNRDTKVLVCHDYQGGYNEDAKVQGSTVDKCYTLSKFWSFLDIFVYFSHHTITIPPVCWIQAAHTNGVLVLGTIITEGDHGQLENLLMIFGDLKNKTAFARKYADILIRIATYYNFDGWFINLESPLPKEHIPHLINFLQYLTEEMHKAKSESLIIWYDALTIEGKVDWQDKLTLKNKDFFDVVDGIFTNYTWKSSYPRESQMLADKRSNDVFTGIDFWGRGQYGGGGFNVHKAIREILKAKTSVAFFATAWCWEYLGKESFEINECRLWNDSSLMPILPDVTQIPSTWPDPQDLGCISEYLITRPLVQPFNTFFNMGFGSKYFINGTLVFDKSGWSHLGRSDIFPNVFPISYRVNYDDAFHGGSSIMLILDESGVSTKNTSDGRLLFPLFKTDIDATNVNISLNIKYSNPQQSKIELYLMIENFKGQEFPWFEEIACAQDWTHFRHKITVSNAKKVKMIGLSAFDQSLKNKPAGILTIGRLGVFISTETSLPLSNNSVMGSIPNLKDHLLVTIAIHDIVYDENVGKYTIHISWPSSNARFYELFLNDTWIGTAFTSQYLVSLPVRDMIKKNVKILAYGMEGEPIADLHGTIEL